MGLIKAFGGAISGTFADQWKDIITAGRFDEHTVVSPGVLLRSNNGRGSNFSGSDGVISNGSKIFVPENTAAFIFCQTGIEEIITEAGGYTYQNGEASIFNGDTITASIFKTAKDRIGYGGQTASQTRVAFVNLREIRDIKFGTQSPLMYHDLFYGADLEIVAFGAFSVKVLDAKKFIKNFVPPNLVYYSFDATRVRAQLIAEFMQSFTDAVNTLSGNYQISQLPSQVNEIARQISGSSSNAGTWLERFGFDIIRVGIESIAFSAESKELVKHFASKKMDMRALEDVSQKAANIAAQQKIAAGIQDHGFGDVPGMFLGMNMIQGLGPQMQANTPQQIPLDQQIETLKRLKELLDVGILSQNEFDAKKKEIMGL
jgi:membrane protease subunit (stomatin/prohibitin family)